MAALCHKRLMRYFKREWSETRGDAFDSWGSSFWYFETEDSEVSPYEITATEFSGVWDSTRAFNR